MNYLYLCVGLERVRKLTSTMLLLAAWCGLRLGEVMALTVADLDLDRGWVTIDKAAAELKSGERLIGPPKTAAGKRVVAIPPHIVPDLRDHIANFAGPAPDGLLVVGTKGQPVRRASFYRAWQRATAACNLSGLRFHDLRHTGATLAATTGASTRELMARLGH